MSKHSPVDQDSKVAVGALIRQIRKEKHILQTDMAQRLGMQPAQLCNIEKGLHNPSVTTLARISAVLNVPMSDLVSNGIYAIDETERAGLSTGPTPESSFMYSSIGGKANPAAPGRDAEAPITGRGLNWISRMVGPDGPLDRKLIEQLDAKVADYLELEAACGICKCAIIPLRLPTDRTDEGAEQLARIVRSHCGIGSAIVFDYIELFENLGFRVIFIDLPPGVDSLSFFDQPNQNLFIFIRKSANSERQLFQMAMQLGNAYLYSQNPGTPVFDNHRNRAFAKRFAAAFLMPADAICATVAQLRIAPDKWTYEMMLRLKQRFGLSAEAFLYRLYELKLITRRLNKQFLAKIEAYYLANDYGEPESLKRSLSINGRYKDLQQLLVQKQAAANTKAKK